MNKDFIFDIFVSYSSSDNLIVTEIAKSLKDSGFSVWFDKWMIKPGDDIYKKIEDGIENSQVLILCMSKSAFSSDWVSLEHSSAIFRDPSNKSKRFIPILLDNCKIPDTIKRYKYIDFSTRKVESTDILISTLQELIDAKEKSIYDYWSAEDINLAIGLAKFQKLNLTNDLDDEVICKINQVGVIGTLENIQTYIPSEYEISKIKNATDKFDIEKEILIAETLLKILHKNTDSFKGYEGMLYGELQMNIGLAKHLLWKNSKSM